MATQLAPLSVTTPPPTEEPKRMKYVTRCVERYFEWRQAGNGDEASSDAEAFIAWDQSENGSKCLDYDRDRNYRAGLIQQATLILLTYTRVGMKVAGSNLKISIPSVVSTPDGYRRVSEMKPAQYEAFLESLTRSARAQALRVRMMGAHRVQVQNALRRAEELANEDFEAEAKKPPRKV